MTMIVLFHHALGLTDGVHWFANKLRAAGHDVHTPDLYEGKTFATLDEGVAYADELGLGGAVERAAAAVQNLPTDVVYAGFSFGAMPAQGLAQTRPGSRGALLFHGGVPEEAFGHPWPRGLPMQIHTCEDDPWREREFVDKLVADHAPYAEVFVYPGEAHLFADPAAGEYLSESADLLIDRTLAFLDRVG